MSKRVSLPPPGPNTPAPWLTWKYSLILPFALIALIGTVVDANWPSNSGAPTSDAGALTAQMSGTAPATLVQTENAVSEIAGQAPESSPVDDVNLVPRAATPDLTNVRIEGMIVDASGDPIQGARITDGQHLAVSGGDGLFEIEIDANGADAALRITASGFHDFAQPAAALKSRIEVTLELQQVKALYLNPNISDTDEDIDRIIDIINTTEANAVVIDIKEEIVYYDSQVPMFVDAGTVRPIMDLAELLGRFKEHDIYTIARLVVFKDGLVAQANPDLAVLNNVTGDLWRDDNGVAWVNPMAHRIWHANVDLAVEAAGYGFDEVQYDYVRFPTDGDFSTQAFGLENTQENRQNSIEGFLALSREKLLPTGVKQSADVFGYSLVVDDDLGIGHNFARLGEYVDYLSPMIYPSHWPNGSLAVDGHPNDFPYETIAISMRQAGLKLDGDMLRVRPWLQDFSFFDLMPYGDNEVRAQIRAVEESGASGWMLWDPNNVYHPGALAPDPSQGTQKAATPVATSLATFGSTLMATPGAILTPGVKVTGRRVRRSCTLIARLDWV